MESGRVSFRRRPPPCPQRPADRNDGPAMRLPGGAGPQLWPIDAAETAWMGHGCCSAQPPNRNDGPAMRFGATAATRAASPASPASPETIFSNSSHTSPSAALITELRRVITRSDYRDHAPGCVPQGGGPLSRPRRRGSALGGVACAVLCHLCAVLGCTVVGDSNPRRCPPRCQEGPNCPSAHGSRTLPRGLPAPPFLTRCQSSRSTSQLER